MNNLSLTVALAADGGCVVYADNGGTEQELVFAGNIKDTTDYIAKRVQALKPVEAPKVTRHGDYLVYNESAQEEAEQVVERLTVSQWLSDGAELRERLAR